MKIKELTINISNTKNLGNYESARIDVGQTIELGPDDNADEVFNEAYVDLKKKLAQKVEELFQ